MEVFNWLLTVSSLDGPPFNGGVDSMEDFFVKVEVSLC